MAKPELFPARAVWLQNEYTSKSRGRTGLEREGQKFLNKGTVWIMYHLDIFLVSYTEQ